MTIIKHITAYTRKHCISTHVPPSFVFLPFSLFLYHFPCLFVFYTFFLPSSHPSLPYSFLPPSLPLSPSISPPSLSLSPSLFPPSLPLSLSLSLPLSLAPSLSVPLFSLPLSLAPSLFVPLSLPLSLPPPYFVFRSCSFYLMQFISTVFPSLSPILQLQLQIAGVQECPG